MKNIGELIIKMLAKIINKITSYIAIANEGSSAAEAMVREAKSMLEGKVSPKKPNFNLPNYPALEYQGEVDVTKFKGLIDNIESAISKLGTVNLENYQKIEIALNNVSSETDLSIVKTEVSKAYEAVGKELTKLE